MLKIKEYKLFENWPKGRNFSMLFISSDYKTVCLVPARGWIPKVFLRCSDKKKEIFF